MLARGARVSTRITLSCVRRGRSYQIRHYAQTKVTNGSSTPSDPSTAIIASLTSELDKIAPHFDLDASQIQVIETPSDFYQTLKAKILNAKSHIFLSTLYIGKDEHDLMDAIRESLRKHPRLTVSILTDAIRGTREFPNASCATLILGLIKDFPDRVEGWMYHTPNLAGWKRYVIPVRINEGWGLQHMKLYGVDSEIIMSGANLSNDYFTNRQDRYHLISSNEVTRYFNRVYSAVCELSRRIVPDGRTPDGLRLEWTQLETPSSIDDPKEYIKAATKTLAPLIRPRTTSQPSRSDTRIYPLFQFTPIMSPDRSTELPALKLVLRRLASPKLRGSSWMFTAGYFNMTPEVRDLLLATNPVSGTVLAASPWANGFYGSKGVSGMLPAAYTYLARQFLTTISKLKLDDRIKLKEWRYGTVNHPGGWTYHAKGLWISLPNEKDPSITLVGSSNYTKRSYSLDLEANALILTTNPVLKKRLGEEQTWLQKHATEVSQSDYEKTERRVGLHVRIAMWITTLIGGAL